MIIIICHYFISNQSKHGVDGLKISKNHSDIVLIKCSKGFQTVNKEQDSKNEDNHIVSTLYSIHHVLNNT